MTTLNGSADWNAHDLLVAKQNCGLSIAVVIPARNEAATVGDVVRQIAAALMAQTALVDELVVMDSLSTDDTVQVARDGGAAVYSVADVRPDLGVLAGKGEALWKSLFVTEADILVFIDADLLEWGVHFVTGLLGPLLTDPQTQLVKGFYDRVFDDRADTQALKSVRPQGGRVTELVARPLLSLRWPELNGIVQPLAGEWAVRRSLIETLTIPTGYGIELATLIDTWCRYGISSVAQVDLGRRAHRHQTIHDLGVMAAEIIAVADRRSGLPGPITPSELWKAFDPSRPESQQAVLRQYDRTAPTNWVERIVPIGERPPRNSVT